MLDDKIHCMDKARKFEKSIGMDRDVLDMVDINLLKVFKLQ